MRKNTWILLMLILVAAMVGGYVAFSQPKKDFVDPPQSTGLKPNQNPPQERGNGEIKEEQEPVQPRDDQEPLPDSQKPIRVEIPEAKKTKIPPVDPDKGERFIEGEVKAVDREKRIITIEQMLDDLSEQVNPDVPLAENAVIQTEEGDITLAQVKAGDLVGMIYTQDGKARAVKVNPRK